MSNNEITGDKLQSKVGNKKAFDEGFDRIFGKKETPKCEGCFTCDCEAENEQKENERQ